MPYKSQKDKANNRKVMQFVKFTFHPRGRRKTEELKKKSWQKALG
jgi:hypothetical protein